jgi:hypothetical protein
MNEPSKSIWTREFFPQLSPWRLLRWLFSWWTIRRGLFGVACLATLTALFYGEENWRGKRAWEKYRRQSEAKGERLELAAVVPPPVPDAQNFALAQPFVDSFHWYWDPKKRAAMQGNTNFVDPLDISIWPARGTGGEADLWTWAKGIAADLAAWQTYYRTGQAPGETKKAKVLRKRPGASAAARLSTTEGSQPAEVPLATARAASGRAAAADVLLMLSKYDDVIEEIRRASPRPEARFPLDYEDGPFTLLPHLSKLKGCGEVLDLRAIAELETGQNERAFADVELALRLADAIRTEPILISQLVRMAMIDRAVQPVWEGLASQRWTAAQLEALQQKFQAMNFLAEYVLAMRGERVWFSEEMREVADRRLKSPVTQFLLDWCAPPGKSEIDRLVASLYIALAPRGWLDWNRMVYAEEIRQQLIAPVNPEAQTVNLEQIDQERVMRDIRQKTHSFLAARVLARFLEYPFSGLHQGILKSVRGQTVANLAALGCALERYRRSEGQFPETLEMLQPRFMDKLPQDLINRQPLKYHRTPDGQFVLYSVGADGKDDGGAYPVTKPAEADSESRPRDDRTAEAGDWVWRYPAK